MRKRLCTQASEWNEVANRDGRVSKDLDVSIRCISDLRTCPKRLVDGIFFEGLDFLRCYSGSFRFSFNDHPDILLTAGDALCTFPRHVVTIDAIEPNSRIVYGTFGGRDVERYFTELGFFDCAKGKTESHESSLMELSAQLDRENSEDATISKMCMSLLSDILRTHRIEMRRDGARVFDAVYRIHANLRHRDFGLKTLCFQLGISRVHLHRLFVESGLGSPSEYIRNCLLRMIRDRLEHSALSFGEIAEDAGFQTASHFSTFVKRMTGLTPSQIRDKGLNI